MLWVGWGKYQAWQAEQERRQALERRPAPATKELPFMKVYVSTGATEPDLAIGVLSTLFSGAPVRFGKSGGGVAVFAPQSVHDEIAEVMDALQAGPPPTTPEELVQLKAKLPPYILSPMTADGTASPGDGPAESP
jgi:hypothetical protein